MPLYSENETVIALLATKNKDLVNLYNIITTQEDEEKVLEFLEKYEHIAFQEDIKLTGLVRFGIELDSDEQRDLRQISDNLAEDFIIIDHNTEPSTSFSFVMIGFGLLLLWIAVRKFRKKAHVEATPEASIT